LSRLEETRQRQLSELQARLAALQTIYTPNHPSVVSLQQNIASLQYESPQIASIKSQLDKLETEYDEKSSADADRLIKAEMSRRASSHATAAPAAPAVPDISIYDTPPPPPAPVENDRPDQATEFATLRLRTELNQLQSILERTDGARIELAVSQAAFKYRYTVIKPAQEPRDPASPNVRLIVLAGLFACLLLALCASVAVDLMSNRILESWQVQRQLGLPILGTVRA
jgi:DNA repair exonuclease SbcCD ATPase subunit